MSGFAATEENALRVVTLYADDAREHGARRWSYSDLAAALGLHPNQARNLGPLLDRVREVCIEQGLPDISSVVVARGTMLPSAKSFNGPGGTWRQTGLNTAGVLAEQDRVLSHDW